MPTRRTVRTLLLGQAYAPRGLVVLKIRLWPESAVVDGVMEHIVRLGGVRASDVGGPVRRPLLEFKVSQRYRAFQGACIVVVLMYRSSM